MPEDVVRTPLPDWPHKSLLYETINDGRIGILTINRPERMNAMDPETRHLWAEAWKRFAADDECWVTIVTGSGDRAFCSGQDLKARADLEEQGGDAPYKGQAPIVTPIGEMLGCWKPTIAAINGYAIAGGWHVAQSCTLRIASEHAEMNIAEARWNQPASFVSWLSRIVGMGHALEICIMADRRITAQRAYEIGFVNKVVPREQLMDEAIDWARRILDLAPRTIRNFNEMIHRCYSMTIPEGLSYAAALEHNLRGMEDSLEGPKAFAEKRTPVFKNR